MLDLKNAFAMKAFFHEKSRRKPLLLSMGRNASFLHEK